MTLSNIGKREIVEISGVPKQIWENCQELVLNLGSKIKVDLKSEDINACHMISSNSDALKIVKLGSRKKFSEYVHAKFNVNKCNLVLFFRMCAVSQWYLQNKIEINVRYVLLCQ